MGDVELLFSVKIPSWWEYFNVCDQRFRAFWDLHFAGSWKLKCFTFIREGVGSACIEYEIRLKGINNLNTIPPLLSEAKMIWGKNHKTIETKYHYL